MKTFFFLTKKLCYHLDVIFYSQKMNVLEKYCCMLFVFLSYFQVNMIILTFQKNFIFTFNLKKNFLHFLCISGINFLVHWTKKSFFMFYWIFCLLLFLNCLKMSTNKSGTIFLFTINTFESIQAEWSGNQEMSRTKKII